MMQLWLAAIRDSSRSERLLKGGLLAVGASVLMLLGAPAAQAATNVIVPSDMPFTQTNSGSVVFNAEVAFGGGSFAFTVTCTSSTVSGTTPKKALTPFAVSPPTFSGCTDSFGGNDTVTAQGKWTLSYVDNPGGDQLVLGVPKGGATLTSSVIQNCVTTVAPKAAGSLKESYDDSTGTVTADASSGSLPFSVGGGSGCYLNGYGGTETFSATYDSSPAFFDTSTVVTNTNDSGEGSLRGAIEAANALGGGTITFAIPGSGVQEISPTTPLPQITAPVTIDGTSQAGKSKYTTPLIRLDGSNAGPGSGLQIGASKSTVKGLEITDWSNAGIDIGGVTKNVIEGNYIGTDGSSAHGNGDGVVLEVTSGDTIGGTAKGTANVISGNKQNGVYITGFGGNSVLGNLIGTDASGSNAIGNGNDGVLIDAASVGNLIGGTAKGDGNLIANNTQNGVQVDGPATYGNSILGNSIFGSGTHTGIDLSSGGNENAPPPTVSNATPGSTTTSTITGSVAEPNVKGGKVVIEVFSNPSCSDPEGKTFLGPATPVYSAHSTTGTWSLKVPTSEIAGSGITATATYPAANHTKTNDTSPFSSCLAAT